MACFQIMAVFAIYLYWSLEPFIHLHLWAVAVLLISAAHSTHLNMCVCHLWLHTLHTCLCSLIPYRCWKGLALLRDITLVANSESNWFLIILGLQYTLPTMCENLVISKNDFTDRKSVKSESISCIYDLTPIANKDWHWLLPVISALQANDWNMMDTRVTGRRYRVFGGKEHTLFFFQEEDTSGWLYW